MSRKIDTGREPTLQEFREAERIAQLHPEQQRNHPSAVPADHSMLTHINRPVRDRAQGKRTRKIGLR